MTPEAAGGLLKLGPSEVSIIGLLLFALLTGWRGGWVFGAVHAASLAEKDKTIAERDGRIKTLEAELKYEREVVVPHWQETTLTLLETGKRTVAISERLADRFGPPPPARP